MSDVTGSSKEQFPNPENDLFSDAMDAAASAFHSTRWGIVKNAEKAGEPSDGERTVRRSLAAAFNAYVAELGPTPEPLPTYPEVMKQAEGEDGVDSITLIRSLTKKVADQKRELARLSEKLHDAKQATQPPPADQLAQELRDWYDAEWINDNKLNQHQAALLMAAVRRLTGLVPGERHAEKQ